MPRAVILRAGLAVAAALGLFWLLGGLVWLEGWALAGQKQFQTTLAASLRALKSAESGAMAGLVLAAFVYGLVHALGPGHGKFVIGGYGLARRVPLLRLTSIAMAAALMQGAVAVALVYGGIGLFGWTRERLGGVEAQVFAPLGQVLVAGIGVWLLWRGGRSVWRLTRPPAPCTPRGPGLFRAYQATTAAEPEPCPDCGHRHGPTLQEIQAATTWKEIAFLILAIGARPCSGALMLLVLTWQIGLVGAGIAGTFAMAIGTGLVTVGVAVMAVWSREGALAQGRGLSRLHLLAPLVELGVGALILLTVWRLAPGL